MYLGPALNGARDQMPSRNPFQLKLLYGSVNLTLNYKRIITEALSFWENLRKFQTQVFWFLRTLNKELTGNNTYWRCSQNLSTFINIYINVCKIITIFTSSTKLHTIVTIWKEMKIFFSLISFFFSKDCRFKQCHFTKAYFFLVSGLSIFTCMLSSIKIMRTKNCLGNTFERQSSRR